MAKKTPQQIHKLKQALADIRDKRHQFGDETFSQVVMALLEKLRRMQTLALPETPDAPLSDEVRLVTVMFVDIKDSTAMSQQIEETSDWKDVIATADEHIASLVSQWDGQIGQYLGDGVLCFFGARHSRSDDASHAVSCALAIQEKMLEYAEEVHAQHGVDFSVRIGISTGRVVVGFVGDDNKQELLALGPATNRASRLQAVAITGSTFIDAATFNRVRGEFITETLEPVHLKGFAEPVAHYRVIAKRAHTAMHFTNTTVGELEMPFVGRERELALISYLCDESLAMGEFRAITLMGDVGIGKSRLLQEILRTNRHQFTQLTMIAQYEHRTRPYHLLRNFITAHCGLTSDMTDEQVYHKIVQTLSNFYDDLQAIQALGYLADFALFERPSEDAVDLGARWFADLATKNGLIVAVDNLQWVDQHAVRFLGRVAALTQHLPCVIIAAGRLIYRDVHPFYMRDQINHTQITLERLHPDQTYELINAIVQYVERVPSTLPELINERVEGNPLFVREYLNMLFDNDVFPKVEEGKWRFNIIAYDAALHTLPTGLVGIIQARFDDLSSEARQIIQAASIAGQTFWATSVHELTNNENAHILLETLAQRGMIIEQPESQFPDEVEYQFRHTLYREVAYKMLPRNQRMAYHQQLSGWLVERIALHNNLYHLLAQQFHLCEAYDAALFTYVEAVEVHLLLNEEDEALSLIDDGLDIARNVPREIAVPMVSKLWSLRGQALNSLLRFEEATAASQSALRLLKELPEDQLVTTRILARRTLGLAYASLGRYEEAHELLNEARQSLPEEATSQMAGVLHSMGIVSLRQGRLSDAQSYQRQAYAYAERAADHHKLVDVDLLQGMIDFERGSIHLALASFESVLASERNPLPRHRRAALMHIGMIQMLLSLPEQAIDYFEQAAENMPPERITEINALRAVALLRLGDMQDGRDLLQTTHEQPHPDIYTHQRIELLYITGLALLNDFMACSEHALQFVDEVAPHNPLLRARGLRWLGYANHSLGSNRAIVSLQEAITNEGIYGGRDLWICHYLMALCAYDDDHAQVHYGHAARILRRWLETLDAYPTLQHNFLQSEMVQGILALAEN